jgi:HpcH/HpaI aldolase/citrate lyase family protein
MSAADMVIIDLEDAVAAEDKDLARAAVDFSRQWLGHQQIKIKSSPYHSTSKSSLKNRLGIQAAMGVWTRVLRQWYRSRWTIFAG